MAEKRVAYHANDVRDVARTRTTRISGISLDDYEGKHGSGLIDPDYVSEEGEQLRQMYASSKDDDMPVPLDKIFSS